MIYVVTSGCYSNYGIDAIFTTREKAERYCYLHPRNDQSIEEWVEDEIPETHSCYKYYYVFKNNGKWLDFDADNVEVDERYAGWYKEEIGVKNFTEFGTIDFYLKSRDDEKAYKIIQDRVAFEKAKEEGII